MTYKHRKISAEKNKKRKRHSKSQSYIYSSLYRAMIAGGPRQLQEPRPGACPGWSEPGVFLEQVTSTLSEPRACIPQPEE